MLSADALAAAHAPSLTNMWVKGVQNGGMKGKPGNGTEFFEKSHFAEYKFKTTQKLTQKLAERTHCYC